MMCATLLQHYTRSCVAYLVVDIQLVGVASVQHQFEEVCCCVDMHALQLACLVPASLIAVK